MTINIILDRTEPGINAETVPNEDGTYTITINKELSRKQYLSELLHELSHIKNNHFNMQVQADLLEKMVRTSNCIPEELEDINFYCHTV